MREYNHLQIEEKWQKEWTKKKVFEAQDSSDRQKYYTLIEFPYPSGDGLHIGHPRPYIGMDVISRKRRMEGFNVLYPIGWDAFGLPTENYAIKTGKQPEQVTKENTDNFRRQIQLLGISFDWSREINTTDPKYYKWTQWLFLKFLEHGLAYKAKMAINWCPKDKIGLANEEVINGCCERCGTPVEKREKEQWMLAITKYAERLDKDLDDVDYLPQIKLQQRNWIGKSEGTEIDFAIAGTEEKVKIFTTRADTIFGATYLVLAPEHEVIQKLKYQILNWEEILQYIVRNKNKTEVERTTDEKEKTGIELKGIKAINPATKEEIPIFIADYVLSTYGTGAIMAVPAHDERDFIFARKYNLPIKQVIGPIFENTTKQGKIKNELPIVERNSIMAIVKHWTEDKYIGLRYKDVDWRTLITGGPEEGQTMLEGTITEIIQETGYLHPKFIKNLNRVHSKFFHIPKKINRFAHFTTFYFELQDGNRQEVSEEEKRIHEIKWLTRDEMTNFLSPKAHKYVWDSLFDNAVYEGEGILTNSGEFNNLNSDEARKKITEKFGKSKIIYKLRDWVFSRQRYWGEPIPVVHCQKCGIVPVPEKDLPVKLPKVKNYQPTDSGESPLASISKWVNTKCPKCKGKAKRETDVMPNWAGSSWYFLRYIDPHNDKEFASRQNLDNWMPIDWYNGGMEHTTLHLLYSRFWNKFLFDIGLVPTSEPYKKRTSHGLILAKGGEKMSKSKGNVINPDDIVKTYGADTLRMYEMFMGPFDQAIAWGEENIIGVRRFLERVWRLQLKVKSGKLKVNTNSKLDALLHKTVKKVSDDIETMGFNTAVSAMMILANEFEKQETIAQSDFEMFLKILSPFAPHIAEELWHKLGNKSLIVSESWPQADESKIKEMKVTIVVQVGSKNRGEIVVSPNASEEGVTKIAQSTRSVEKWLSGKEIKKIIYVPGRLINFVIN